MKKKLCAQCKACRSDQWESEGIAEEQAEWYVEGTIYGRYSDKPVPYRAYLCGNHKVMLEDDGATWKKEVKIL